MSDEIIMVVDDDILNLRVAKNALSDGYEVFTAPSAAKMFDLLTRNTPRLILLDIAMPDMDGYEAARRLKDNPATKDIPIVFLTALHDPENEVVGLSIGAIDYIKKPFMPQLLRKRVELHIMVEDQKRQLEAQTKTLHTQQAELRHLNDNLLSMVEEKTREIVTLQEAILMTVANLVENRDKFTGGHITRTQHCLKVVFKALTEFGLYRDEIRKWDTHLLLQSAQLHDVGKISIADCILNKQGPLTDKEFTEMKRHVELGIKIVSGLEAIVPGNDFLRYAKVLVETHHEKWDGSGYPKGLVGEAIPVVGRLMAIVDVYDALISERPYKKPLSPEQALGIIAEGRGKHFDPVITDVFMQSADRLSF
ncbi:MAG: response regulator [Desulfovibrio sp.]|nr:response regulator [Desulfovibrio sp.]